MCSGKYQCVPVFWCVPVFLRTPNLTVMDFMLHISPEDFSFLDLPQSPLEKCHSGEVNSILKYSSSNLAQIMTKKAVMWGLMVINPIPFSMLSNLGRFLKFSMSIRNRMLVKHVFNRIVSQPECLSCYFQSVKLWRERLYLDWRCYLYDNVLA